MNPRTEVERRRSDLPDAPGIRLSQGELPPAYVQAVREIMFHQGDTIARIAVGTADDVALVVPTGRWSAAPLLFLRHLEAPNLSFIPVDNDSAALDLVTQRVRTELPHLAVHPHLAREPFFIPAGALSTGGRVILFLPWCPEIDVGGGLPEVELAATLLTRNGCVLAGGPMRRVPLDAEAWPANLHVVGAWPDANAVASLVLLEAGSP